MSSRLDLINELLRFHDIEGLLSMGAPGDEYESEARMIADRVDESKHRTPDDKVTKEEVAAIIASIWREMFGLSDDQLLLRREAFDSIAARLAT